MLKRDGSRLNRESERRRWAYVHAVESELLAHKTAAESLRDLEILFESTIGTCSAEAQREAQQARIELQQRLRLAARHPGLARG